MHTMIVPEFWAEARRHKRTHAKQFTVRRFGWSDESQEAAQRHAEERAEAAFERLVGGEEILRREPKVPYNGADGVPIREQIVARHGDTVITRNSYGAKCLNTPDVLFADVDFKTGASLRLGLTIFGVLALASLGYLLAAGASIPTFLGMLVASALICGPIAALTHKGFVALRGGPVAMAQRAIRSFADAHRDWHLRVYRTPAGFRVLVMHATFDPRGDAVARFFEKLSVDPIYARMCKVQNCFRARVSPKPWRIGIGEHMKPRPGVWPVNPARLADRQRWLDHYDETARDYAACRFVESLGESPTDARAEAVRELHDRLCRSDSGAPIA